MTAEYAVLIVPLGTLLVVMATLDAAHRDANTTSKRESCQDFITLCWRDYRIPNRYQRFGTFWFCIRSSNELPLLRVYDVRVSSVEERDTHSIARCSTSHHGLFRVVPRTELFPARNPIPCATSRTAERLTCGPWLPWRSSARAASPGGNTYCAIPGCCAP